MAALLHFEDFHEGQVIRLDERRITAEEIIAFAREFDPQPFHLDEAAAKASVLGGLCASGWHSSALLVRMICESYLLGTAAMGSNGMDEVKWLKPVYAGEMLTGEGRVLSARRSKSRPEIGILKMLWRMTNVAGETKIEATGVAFIRTRTPC
ncbi:MAG: MaoC family dehydratase [Aestuariivirga sp.]